jgi:methyl-accepting chemotaxis protein
MKLGMKLGLSFGLFIAILCGLGLMAIVTMRSAEGDVSRLSTEYVPEVAVANELERNVQQSMHNMTEYVLSQRQKHWDDGQKLLSEVRANLDAAKALAEKYPALVKLKQNAAAAETALAGFAQRGEEIHGLMVAVSAERDAMAKSAAVFAKNCADFQTGLIEKLRQDGEAVLDPETSVRLLGSLVQANDILAVGNEARVRNLKSQATHDPAVMKQALANFPKIEEIVGKLEALTTDEDGRARIKDIRSSAEVYKQSMTKLQAMIDRSAEIADALDASAADLLDAAVETAQAGIDRTQQIADDSTASLDTASTVYIAGLALAVLAGIGLAFVLTRGISGPIRHSADFAQTIAAGNLDQTLAIDQNDEVGQLAGAMNTMVESLKQKIAEAEAQHTAAKSAATEAEKAMQEARRQEEQVSALLSTMQRISGQAEVISERVSSASEELAAQIEQASHGSEIQRERMTETATAMVQMNTTVVEVARNASEAAKNSDSARTEADSGAAVVGESVTAIGEVQTVAAELQANMRALGTQAEAIGTVMNVISDIADQTNLLALNAAIEAARAGDAGRGFAVVADEVRKLAEKTMGATKEVGQNIRSIQDAVQLNLANMDRAAQAVHRATQLAGKSGEALTRIVGLVGNSARQVEGIATASEEQSSASEQISRAVDEVNRIVGETAEGMVQSARAVQELASMSAELRGLMAELVKAG